MVRMPKATERSCTIKNKYYPLDLALSKSLVTLVRAVEKVSGVEARFKWAEGDSDPVFTGLPT